MSRSELSNEVRLFACDAVKTRFEGRVELRRRAAVSGYALIMLEHRLGIASDAELEQARSEELRRQATTGQREGEIGSELLRIRRERKAATRRSRSAPLPRRDAARGNRAAPRSIP